MVLRNLSCNADVSQLVAIHAAAIENARLCDVDYPIALNALGAGGIHRPVEGYAKIGAAYDQNDH